MNRVHISPSWKFITWTSTTVCNYKCTYCTDDYNGGKFRWIEDYSPIVNYANDFRENMPLVFDIIGGEPTLWPKLQDFCNEISKSDAKTVVTFTTNGSRSINYWKNFSANVSVLGFSFHPEFASEIHFKSIFNELHKRYKVECFLMMPPRFYDRIKSFYKNLLESDLEINVRIKLVSDWHTNTGLISGYTDEMIEFSRNRFNNSKIKDLRDYSFFVDDVETNMRDLINTRQNSFKDWHCYGGKDQVLIEADGTIYGSSCKSGVVLGNVFSDYAKFKNPAICKLTWCDCGHDIEIYKVKI